MHYLVTGAQGFLGRQVVRALRTIGATVIASGRRRESGVYCCDLSAKDDVARMISQVNPGCIIHCAAYVPKNSAEYLDNNKADLSVKMLESILIGSRCPVVLVSSMTVYGDRYQNKIVEEDAGNPISDYGIGKWKAELRLKESGRWGLAIRIPGLFGPDRRSGLVYNILHALKYDHELPPLPDTEVVWAAMHVVDAAESIVRLAISPITCFEQINIAYRGIYSISEFFSIAGSMYDRSIAYDIKQPKLEFDLSRADARSAVPGCTLRDALQTFGAQL